MQYFWHIFKSDWALRKFQWVFSVRDNRSWNDFPVNWTVGCSLWPVDVPGAIMANSKLVSLLVLMTMALAGPSHGAGTLHGPIRIASGILGYDLQYWVYLPGIVEQPLPELYLTDGQGYLTAGDMVRILDDEIAAGSIAPVAAIFVDSRDPDQLSNDRRNQQFMCNADYGKFFLGELIPEISARWTNAGTSTRRGLSGISFGAINAACFGLMIPGVFQVLIMQSPASGKHVDAVRQLYEDQPRQPSAIFISHGGRLDNAAAANRFIRTLEQKGYPLRIVKNHGRHDWNNWRPLIDDSLRAFVGLKDGDRVD